MNRFDALEVSGGAVRQAAGKRVDHPIMEGGNGLSRAVPVVGENVAALPQYCATDEPSASLDEHTEREFIQRLHRGFGNRTPVVATHRHQYWS